VIRLSSCSTAGSSSNLITIAPKNTAVARPVGRLEDLASDRRATFDGAVA
jgi:hypothetical protein